ncbi:ammonium transporter [Luteolibacter sp. SL250]|uniref:ammonium transporter n=1 Tax=Luteolibacter sp. SL250 TaxID=2995170 RepID=UPI00226FE8E6|nr:ammonium transporter [Luteolibacter sp. SL250]WAC20862.1 ammonium transporter [Luteolibacter sp. SL250]
MTSHYLNKLRATTAAAIALIAMPMVAPSHAQETPPAAPPVEAPAAPAAAPAAAATPTVEERLADIEAYMNNVPRPDKESGADSLVAGPGPGHNAWQMVSTALVLFMTLPGLALFYGGLVRKKNVLSVLAQCLACACVITPIWFVCGYSLCFGAGNALFGDFTYAFFKGVEPGNVGAGFVWISDSMWAMFQLTFAIITPALIVGAIAERMKFVSLMAFIILWMFAVYFPFAHMVWSGTGLMCGPLNAEAGIKAIDFAGGTVVHMTSGWSALVLCLILGKRRGFGKEPMPPHSMVLCMVGTGMLWVGWYGFNAGSALGADSVASNAFVTTTLCAATAGLFWALTEWIFKGKPSVLGFCSGIVAGLVVITPAAGFVSASSAMIMGVLGGIVPFLAVAYLKKAIGYDDALDTFGVHGVGGTLGAILTGVFASADVHPVIKDMNLADGLLMAQFKAVGLTIVWSVVATVVIAYVVKAVFGLRPSAEDEETGLDLVDHGEQGYEGH